jgi:hypothetical protein
MGMGDGDASPALASRLRELNYLYGRPVVNKAGP